MTEALSPILVTGMPRSGTTWVARELAQGRRTALAGREPMNPRESQHALGGTVRAWTRIATPTRRQTRLLRFAYSGWDPRVYSRYGHRQWAAPLPWTRVVVKDPFALLSLPAISKVTQAHAVVVYRHPAAVLASFRRMGWAPDPAEVNAIESMDPGHLSQPSFESGVLPADAALVARMWRALYRAFLFDAPQLTRLSIVAHSELTTGTPTGLRALRRACGLSEGKDQRSQDRPQQVKAPSGHQLHNFDRSAQEVREAWRERTSEAEIALLEESVAPVWRALEDLRLPVDTDPRS